MEKVKKEMLEKLKNVKSMEEDNLEMLGKSESVEVEDVKYLGTVELNYKEDEKITKEKINVYAVIEGKTIKYYSDDMALAAETLGVGKNKQGIIPSPEYERKFEQDNPIKDIIENLKQNEIEEQEKPEEERSIISLKDLEEEEEKEKDSETKDEKEERNQNQSYKISNIKGEVNLDQQVNGETLRKILGLGEEYKSIAPVPASSVGVHNGSKYCFVAIKNDSTCMVLEEDIIKEDRQEGTNPYDKDTKVNNDGSVTKESTISGYKIVNRPNFHLFVGYDENSSTRQTIIRDVSGRESRKDEVGFELEKKGDGRWQNSDVRNELRKEQGIEKPDNMKAKNKEHESTGCEEKDIKDIDENENNNTHYHIDPEQKIPGTDITWQRFANMCGYRGEKDGVQKAFKEFKECGEENKDLSNEEIIETIIEEKEKEMPGPDRRR